MVWSTVLKAFFRSRNTTPVRSLASIFLYMTSTSFDMQVPVAWYFLNLNWASDISLNLHDDIVESGQLVQEPSIMLEIWKWVYSLQGPPIRFFIQWCDIGIFPISQYFTSNCCPIYYVTSRETPILQPGLIMTSCLCIHPHWCRVTYE